MTRLIDANKLWQKVFFHTYPVRILDNENKVLNEVLKIIDNAPTVEPQMTELEEHFYHRCGFLQGMEYGKEIAITQDNWIPVSERLPERYEEVIVTDIETSETYVSRYIGNGYWECDNGTYKNRIIAWQELPKPYKEAENEQ